MPTCADCGEALSPFDIKLKRGPGAKANTPVTEPELKNILERYQTSNFTAVPAEPVTPEERRKISSALKGLYHETLAKVYDSVGLLRRG